MKKANPIKAGLSFPLGSTLYPDGVNFSIYSQNSTAMELLLFDSPEALKPSEVILLDLKTNRTFYYWHVFIPGLKAGQVYAYRAHGPYKPSKGLRFNCEKVLIDPYARRVIVPKSYSRAAAAAPGDNVVNAMRSMVTDLSNYDWEGDTPLNIPLPSTVIYEMHVAGFTKNPNSGVTPEKRGTFLGLIEKIPYLKDLGITAVELMPVFQFDMQDAPEGLTNYWGYNPISFFAPHSAYASSDDPHAPLDEFRQMVKTLHQAGIEVILDVVYNHTAEGNENGPTFSFKGLDNNIYYILENDDPAKYANYSGTGNTMNANYAEVRRLILDSLRFWVRDMHVDGFRFDLAAILSRDENGTPLANPPVLWDIETDPVLAGTKLIAEAWDAAGLYQVGTFIGNRWVEWNGKFRDDVRSFLHGDKNKAKIMASRFFASPDLYGHEEREPEQSINFVTSHDGFTLNDLVSYNKKHNVMNGENNRDGDNYNLSFNFGVEGPTDDPAIEHQRNQQVKNFLTILLSALGVPMILMGHEVRRTQHGNNNAYCQDNEISWFDWSLLEKFGDIHNFVRNLIRLRLSLDIFRQHHGLRLNQLLRLARIEWHGVKLNQPDWSADSHSLAFTIRGMQEQFHIILNAYWEPLTFQLPPISGDGLIKWRRVVDTSLDPPQDFCSLVNAPCIEESAYTTRPRSVVIFAAER